MATVRAHLRISGVVQGVFYRNSAQDKALDLGVTGWVRNLDTGEVEAEVEGPEALVDDFIAWCHQGPPAARVDSVQVEKLPPQGKHSSFTVLR